MELRNKAKESFIWSFLIQSSFQIIGFVVTIILARVLEPKDFGLIGIVTVFIILGRTLLDGGLASSLIRNKEVNQSDYSTVFFTNVAVALILFITLFIAAPGISFFFSEPVLTKVLRVYGLVFLLGSFTIVQSVRLNKNLDFKTQFKLLLPSLIISASVSIWMAYNGFGVWSLVIKELLFTFIAGLQLWLYSKWWPSWIFSKQKFKYHLNFGYKLALTELMGKAFNDSFKVLIGKQFSMAQLGLFTRAKSMEELPNSVVFNAINRVMYPLLAHVSDDKARLKSVYRQIIATVVFAIVPLLTLLALLAKPLFIVLLTEKWNDAVPYFQILILAALLSPMQAYFLNICKVKGRSDLVLKLALLEYGLIALGLVLSYFFGMPVLLWSLVGIAFIKVLVSARVVGKLIDYSLKEQLTDIYQPYLLSFISGLCLWLVSEHLLGQHSIHIVVLVVSTLFFLLCFGVLSFIIKNEVFMKAFAYGQAQIKRLG